MPRTIKRYESRKLYDSAESRYVSLQEVAAWIRDGQEIEVIDNATDEVVTSQTLAQIILDEGRSGRGRLSPELLHDLVRASGEKISNGVTQVQKGLHRLVRASFDRLGPVKEARAEMRALRQRLDLLEKTGQIRSLNFALLLEFNHLALQLPYSLASLDPVPVVVDDEFTH